MNTSIFPADFQTMAHFAPDWVLANPLERQRKRSERSLATVKAF